MKNPTVKTSATLISLVLGASLLSACGRDDNRTVGQKADTAIAQTERGAQQAGAEVREAGRSVGEAAGNAADAVANTTRDVGITASVNAKLAADERLSALKINVDTSNGRVVLRGTAPDTEARSRATELARSVEGVTDVNNELSVQAR
jgi:osmotically-inducible protein OsmY